MEEYNTMDVKEVVCMKKRYLEEFWNGVHLEQEEKEDLEIHGCKK